MSQPALSQEFYLRVNDFIHMANRIERRYDTRHAQLAMLHAFCRYSAHHFRSTTTRVADPADRDAFADYIGSAVKQLVLQHVSDLSGPGTAPLAGEGETGSSTAGDSAAE